MILSYTNIAIKLALGLISLIIVINITGKGNLAPSSAIDAVQNYVLGGIIGGVIYNNNISILQYLVILMIWICLVLSMRWLKTNSSFFKVAIDGKPVVLISRGKLDTEACRTAGLTAHEVMFKLRSNGIYSIKTVKQAVLEQNGQLIIVKAGEENPRFPLITDGTIQLQALDSIDKTEEWLMEKLKEQDVENISDVFLAEYENGNLNLVKY
ncbi:hypothetical protein HMPREF9625_00525 [Oribacterium parvum ACB1]|jgi:hypothetical membrane spanning protein|uniref:DUF421 domain-containing protein n=1 Tax=Oribacterium parvum ACB1 TaxID=796943 RepID=G9WME2_9FIRM|nr:DUF421 domain-containing protein [Oribacterium parvum]EHL11695.1 hypothetical protein HMPREF9625_00525 [Oribacterium parvum ACB1]EJF13674.1 PF04239 family protein [Oribacterium parvum ACB8]